MYVKTIIESKKEICCNKTTNLNDARNDFWYVCNELNVDENVLNK